MQDLNYCDVKYIIDKTYQQRQKVREDLNLYRQDKNIKRRLKLRKSLFLYRTYTRHMSQVMDSYLARINTQSATEEESFILLS